MANMQDSDDDNFHIDDRVAHRKFGEGRVTSVTGNSVTVEFKGCGPKKVKAAPLVLLSRASGTPPALSVPDAQPDASQLQASLGVRKQLLDHVHALHTRYDAKPDTAQGKPQEGLRAKMQAHLETLRHASGSEGSGAVSSGLAATLPSGLPSFISLAGVTFEGRQQNLARARMGDTVDLVRRPENAFDPNAVEVLALNGESLGWVPKVQAVRMAPLMDAGTAIRGQISALTGNLEAGYNLGATIALSWDGSNLECDMRSTDGMGEFDADWEPPLSEDVP